jgi:hypothetical protein
LNGFWDSLRACPGEALPGGRAERPDGLSQQQGSGLVVFSRQKGDRKPENLLKLG